MNKIFFSACMTVVAMTAQTATWTGGAGSSDWTDDANWNPSAPAAGDNVTIPSGIVNMPSIPAGTWPATGAYGAFTVASGATVTCEGDPSAINAASGGTAEMPHGAGVTINCASADISGHVSANNQGFGAKGGPGGWAEGACHGGPPHLDNILYPNHYWGASRGSAGSSFQQPYGSITEPTALGSGGNGTGGGAVKIAATGAVTVNGSITALASNRSSGGSIWIAAGTAFSGSGTIDASGDNSTRGGSGGRVSITCRTSNWSGTISVAGGDASHSDGAPGTLWAPWLFADKIGTEGNPVDVTLSGNYSYVFPDTTTPHYWNLTIPAGAHSELHSGFLHLGTLTVRTGARFRLDNWGSRTGDDVADFDVKSIVLEGTAQVALPSCSIRDVYELDTLSLASGSLLYVGWGDKTDVNASSGGTTAHPHGSGVTIRCANPVIAGTLSAKGRGFGARPERNNVTIPCPVFSTEGNGHGGISQYNGGYGQISRPTALGSGNYAYAAGGAIKMEVSGTLLLEGTITADGGEERSSGGSVWIQANRLSGNGVISANGNYVNRNGAGGRVAVEAVDTTLFSGSFFANGSRSTLNISYPGSIFTNAVPDVSAFGWRPDYGSISSDYSYSVCDQTLFPDLVKTASGAEPYVEALVVGRNVSSWDTNANVYVWTEACATKSGTAVTNSATYTLSGLPDETWFTVKVNGVCPDGFGKARPTSGSLTFTGELPVGGAVVDVRPWEASSTVEDVTGPVIACPSTGSQVFCNSTNVAIVSYTVPEGAKEWTITESADISSLQDAVWASTNTPPTLFATTEAEGDHDVAIYLWFTDNANSEYGYRRGLSNTLRCTSARPTASSVSSYSHKMAAERLVVLDGSALENGSTGGVSSGDGIVTMNIPVFGYAVRVKSGPQLDLDDNDTTITLTTAGEYVFTFYAVNAAGNLSDGVDVGVVIDEVAGVPLVDLTDPVNGVPTGSVRSAGNGNSTRPPSYAFDNTGNAWLPFIGSAWIVWEFNSATVVDAYRFNWDDVAARMPRDYALYGTNGDPDDDGAWVLIDSRTDQTCPAGTWKYHETSNSTAYKYYKFRITRNYGDGTYTGVKEMEFFNLLAAKEPVMGALSASILNDGCLEFSSTVVQCGSTPVRCYLFSGATDGGTVAAAWDSVTEIGSYGEMDDVHGILSTLSPATQYYARICASNEYGTAWTEAASATTWSAPVLGECATGVVSDAAAAFSLELASGIGALLGVEISLGGATVASQFAAATSNGTYQVVLDGLEPESQYIWRPVASNIFGVVRGEGASFTTPAIVTARTSAGDGRWSDMASWTPVGVPAAGQTVTILSGHTITIDTSSAIADVINVASGGTLVFDGWNSLLTAGAVTVDGTVTHAANTATAADGNGEWVPNGRVNVVCSTFTINQGGLVDGKGLGFLGADSGSDGTGRGPGGGMSVGDGGSHGGLGGITVRDLLSTFGTTYDSVSLPELPGSGGANQDRRDGGKGGGVVKIVASGAVTVNGSINVDGRYTTMGGNHWSGGAGGAVYIACEKIIGTGSITANGADSRYMAGAGGGGRIAIDYDPVAQAAEALPLLRIQAIGGGANYERTILAGHPRFGTTGGGIGTLWFPDSQFLTRFATTGGTFRLAGLWAAEDAPSTLTVNGDVLMDDGALAFANPTDLSINGNLVISGRAVTTTTAALPATLWGNRLEVAGGTLTINGNLNATNAVICLDSSDCVVTGNVDVVRARLIVDSDGVKRPCLTIGGNASFNASAIHICSGAGETVPAAIGGLTLSGGSLFMVGGTLSLAAKSFAYPHSNLVDGSSPWFRLGALNVDATSGFDAFALGYPGYIYAAGHGKGPGGGWKATLTKYLGAGGYGGVGGNATNVNGVAYGATYGVATAPFGPGSGSASGERYSPSAGGSIRIYCDGDVLLNGMLNANGGSQASGNWYAGSSGGAVWLICRKLTGTAASAAITARGGDGYNGNSSVGGGGGRVAVWTGKTRDVPDKLFGKLLDGHLGYAKMLPALSGWAGTVDVTAGVLYERGSANTVQLTPPGDGTAVFLRLPGSPSTVIELR